VINALTRARAISAGLALIFWILAIGDGLKAVTVLLAVAFTVYAVVTWSADPDAEKRSLFD
jgi:hypothetical protein